MAENESSVLFSLRELRGIDDQRRQDEDAARRAAEEAATRARLEAERVAREQAEARQQAIAEAERAAREAVEHAAREERIRIEEAERRARVEAQARLEQQRMAQEMEIRALEVQKRRPTGLIAVAVVLVLAVAGLGVFLVKRGNEADALARKNAAYQSEVERQTNELKGLVAEQNRLIDELRAAKTAEERQRAEAALKAKQDEIAAQERALQELRSNGSKGSKPGVKKPGAGGAPEKKPLGKDCDPNDPLGCI
jgi:hypothetical protein